MLLKTLLYTHLEIPITKNIFERKKRDKQTSMCVLQDLCLSMTFFIEKMNSLPHVMTQGKLNFSERNKYCHGKHELQQWVKLWSKYLLLPLLGKSLEISCRITVVWLTAWHKKGRMQGRAVFFSSRHSRIIREKICH